MRRSRRILDRAAIARDASHFLLIPGEVAYPAGLDDVAGLLASDDQPVTFRSGGSSLSGQASTSGLMVETRTGFAAVEVLSDGARVRCGPGATVRAVNARLAPYGRRLGPDPASEIACTIGGVVANNSSGMSSGHLLTAYHTLESMVAVLPSGTVIDTAAPDADARLRHLEPAIHDGLLSLRDRVRGNRESVALITRMFAMKNTMGYSLNAFLDHDDPVRILEHLIVGSEGTLAFIASAVLRTVPAYAHASTALLVFEDLPRAIGSVGPLVAADPMAIELMDAISLRVSQRSPQVDDSVRTLDVVDHAALLVEVQHDGPEALADLERTLGAVVDQLPTLRTARFTRDPARRADLWQVRKGLYTAVAGARPTGTTALLEDVVVPRDRLEPTVVELQRMLARHGYDDSVIFGHARDANLHFMINPRLDDPAQLRGFASFTDDLVDLVLGHGGSLKAEHGTGRMMAPFVRRQYGDELYDVMRRLKDLVDPRHRLNPGVILVDDPDSHLRDLKVVPAVSAEVDRCVDCGYCEPGCPSRTVTTTPRQRIALMRHMELVDAATRAELESAFRHDGVETCAADSLCARACPVSIDTGSVMKSLRAQSRGAAAQRIGTSAARRFPAVLRTARTAVAAADALPGPVARGGSRAARALLGADNVPLADDRLPGAGRRRRAIECDSPDIVYFPSCLGSMLESGVSGAFLELCARAGIGVRTPSDVESLCCSVPWDSKGLVDGRDLMRDLTAASLLAATEQGRIPVVSDAASCSHGLHVAGVTVVDSVAFAARELLPRLPAPPRRLASMALHPTCSTVHLGVDGDLIAVARAVADEVVVPDAWGCCGMAGDRGLLHPELSEGATRAEADEISGREYAGYASANRACEMAMTRATGRDYRHVIELLADAYR